MQNIQNLTRTINVFVRFFESINCLFWQIGWLQQNFTNQSSERLFFFLVIFLLCIYITFPGEFDHVSTLAPILIVLVLVGMAVWLIQSRMRRNASADSPDVHQGGGGHQHQEMPHFPPYRPSNTRHDGYETVYPADQFYSNSNGNGNNGNNGNSGNSPNKDTNTPIASAPPISRQIEIPIAEPYNPVPRGERPFYV